MFRSLRAARTPTSSDIRCSGRDVYFGDAANPAFLKSCGIEHAKAVIVTATGRADIDEIVKAAGARCG